MLIFQLRCDLVPVGRLRVAANLTTIEEPLDSLVEILGMVRWRTAYATLFDVSIDSTSEPSTNFSATINSTCSGALPGEARQQGDGYTLNHTPNDAANRSTAISPNAESASRLTPAEIGRERRSRSLQIPV